jgi:hypothetical protein
VPDAVRTKICTKKVQNERILAKGVDCDSQPDSMIVFIPVG